MNPEFWYPNIGKGAGESDVKVAPCPVQSNLVLVCDLINLFMKNKLGVCEQNMRVNNMKY